MITVNCTKELPAPSRIRLEWKEVVSIPDDRMLNIGEYLYYITYHSINQSIIPFSCRTEITADLVNKIKS